MTGSRPACILGLLSDLEKNSLLPVQAYQWSTRVGVKSLQCWNSVRFKPPQPRSAATNGMVSADRHAVAMSVHSVTLQPREDMSRLIPAYCTSSPDLSPDLDMWLVDSWNTGHTWELGVRICCLVTEMHRVTSVSLHCQLPPRGVSDSLEPRRLRHHAMCTPASSLYRIRSDLCTYRRW